MASQNETNRSIALSALVQAANLVDRLASQGQIPQTSFEIMRASLFRFDAKSIEEIYQPPSSYQSNAKKTENSQFEENAISYERQAISQSLHAGIRVCKKVFQEGASQEYPHTIRYTMALIQLEKHFRSSAEMQNLVKDKLLSITSNEDKEINEIISALYLESLATLPFRIQVLGKMQHLQNTENEHRVRVLLFAGIRAAMLWQQYGGRRWHLLLARKSINRGLDSIQ